MEDQDQAELAAICAAQRDELAITVDEQAEEIAGLRESLCVAQAQTAEAREIAEGFAAQVGDCPPVAPLPWNAGPAV